MKSFLVIDFYLNFAKKVKCIRKHCGNKVLLSYEIGKNLRLVARVDNINVIAKKFQGVYLFIHLFIYLFIHLINFAIQSSFEKQKHNNTKFNEEKKVLAWDQLLEFLQSY